MTPAQESDVVTLLTGIFACIQLTSAGVMLFCLRRREPRVSWAPVPIPTSAEPLQRSLRLFVRKPSGPEAFERFGSWDMEIVDSGVHAVPLNWLRAQRMVLELLDDKRITGFEAFTIFQGLWPAVAETGRPMLKPREPGDCLVQIPAVCRSALDVIAFRVRRGDIAPQAAEALEAVIWPSDALRIPLFTLADQTTAAAGVAGAATVTGAA